MKNFIKKHTQKITGTVACFDRTIFKGHIPFRGEGSMERFMTSQWLLMKGFKPFVLKQSEPVKQHGRAVAETSGRPYVLPIGRERKEERARPIKKPANITQKSRKAFP